MINTVDDQRPHGSARDVLDYIEWIELVDYVRGISDSIWTANAVLPTFLKNRKAAQRGRMIT